MSTGSSAPKIEPVPEASPPASETVLEPIPLDPKGVPKGRGRSIGKRIAIPSRRGVVRWLRRAPNRIGGTRLLFLLVVLIPTSIYSGYMFFVATPLYVAETKFAIRSLGPRQSQDVAAGLFANVSSEKVEDANQVLSFVESSKMLEALDEQAGFTAKASTSDVDYFTRLDPDAPIEKRLELFRKFIQINYDEHAGLFTLAVEAIDPSDAVSFIGVIVRESEALINEISVKLAQQQLDFIQQQVDAKRKEYLDISKRIVAAQNEMSLLDPSGEATSVNMLIYTLEGELASDRAELAAKRSYLTDDSVEVFQLNERIQAKTAQIGQLRARLVGKKPETMNALANRFKTLQLEAELTQQTYAAALETLETARVNASEGLKKLVVVVPPFVPEEATEPNATWNVFSFIAFALIAFYILLVIRQVSREHRD